MAKELISSSATKSVYRDGNTAIKEFCEGFQRPKSSMKHCATHVLRTSKH